MGQKYLGYTLQYFSYTNLFKTDYSGTNVSRFLFAIAQSFLRYNCFVNIPNFIVVQDSEIKIGCFRGSGSDFFFLEGQNGLPTKLNFMKNLSAGAFASTPPSPHKEKG